jgi:5-methylcytosine-specific restriction endonuclease McrA
MGKANYKNGSRANLTYKIPKGSIPWNKGLKGQYTTGRRKEWVTIVCSDRDCSKAFEVQPSEFRRMFCSGYCSGKVPKHTKPHSEDTKYKMSVIKIGRHISPSTEFRRNPDTPEKQYIRSSSVYKKWRTSVFERDKYTCQVCGEQGGYLQADHIKPFAIFAGLRLELSNGRTLCKPCHKNTETYGKNIYLLNKMFQKELST